MKKVAFLGLVLTLLMAMMVPALAAPPAQGGGDIVDIAVADGRFTTLVTAVTEAGLVDTLKSDGPFTVFAPTDDAFAKLPAGTLDTLLADKEALTDVLLYHVVSGKVMAADVVNLTSAEAVNGKTLNIKVENGNVFINDSQVIITDIEASNGVIHVIDTVLIPPAEMMAPAELPTTGGAGSSSVWFAVAGLMAVTAGFWLKRRSSASINA